MSWAVTSRSANLKREDKADRKEDVKKSEDGGGEKSKDQDDQKPGPSERSRTTKSGVVARDTTCVFSLPGWCGLWFAVVRQQHGLDFFAIELSTFC